MVLKLVETANLSSRLFRFRTVLQHEVVRVSSKECDLLEKYVVLFCQQLKPFRVVPF